MKIKTAELKRLINELGSTPQGIRQYLYSYFRDYKTADEAIEFIFSPRAEEQDMTDDERERYIALRIKAVYGVGRGCPIDFEEYWQWLNKPLPIGLALIFPEPTA